MTGQDFWICFVLRTEKKNIFSHFSLSSSKDIVQNAKIVSTFHYTFFELENTIECTNHNDSMEFSDLSCLENKEKSSFYIYPC